ncbi:MAG: DMT family transporter [Rhodospirillaceae bacterium]|nr:DMT family transporter [Rhodospirillaceae bacterium]
MSPTAKGIALVSLGVLILSPDALLIRLISTDVWTLLFFRGLGQVTMLGTVLLLREGGGAVARLRFLGGAGLAAGLAFSASQIGFVAGVRLTSPANVLILVSLAPLAAALFSWLLMGERLAHATALAILGAVAGVVITVWDRSGAGSWVGDLVALTTPFTVALAITLLRFAPAIDTRLVLMVSGCGAMATSALLGAPALPSGLDFLWLALLGLVVSPVSFLLISQGPRYLPAAEVGLLMLLELVFGTLWVWLALAEAPSANALIGGGLLLATMIAHSLWALTRRPAVPATDTQD